MKKFYTLLSATLVAGSLFAQRSVSDVRTFEYTPALNPSATEAVSDTVSPVITCGSITPSLYTDPDGGYITGTNSFGDTEKATLYNASSSVKVTDALVYFAAKESVNGGSLVAYVYQFDTNATTISAGMGSPVATSDPVSVGSIDTTGNYTAFHFSTPATVNGVYAVSIQVDNGSDTVGILSTQVGCGGNLALEKWDDGTWVQIADPNNSWGADIAMYIFSVTNDNISVNENTFAAGTLRAFPNPATDKVNISYDLVDNFDVTIRVMDIQGRVVAEMNQSQIAGEQSVELNTAELSNGTYFYSVQSGEAVMNGKFVVRH